MPRWMARPCAKFSVRWPTDDRAVPWRSGLPGLRRDGHAEGGRWLGDAGAAEPAGEPVRWISVCLPRPSIWTDQADLARRHRALHADEAARARSIPVAIRQHDRADRIDVGTAGCAARWVRVAS